MTSYIPSLWPRQALPPSDNKPDLTARLSSLNLTTISESIQGAEDEVERLLERSKSPKATYQEVSEALEDTLRKVSTENTQNVLKLVAYTSDAYATEFRESGTVGPITMISTDPVITLTHSEKGVVVAPADTSEFNAILGALLFQLDEMPLLMNDDWKIWVEKIITDREVDLTPYNTEELRKFFTTFLEACYHAKRLNDWHPREIGDDATNQAAAKAYEDLKSLNDPLIKEIYQTTTVEPSPQKALPPRRSHNIQRALYGTKEIMGNIYFPCNLENELASELEKQGAVDVFINYLKDVSALETLKEALVKSNNSAVKEFVFETLPRVRTGELDLVRGLTVREPNTLFEQYLYSQGFISHNILGWVKPILDRNHSRFTLIISNAGGSNQGLAITKHVFQVPFHPRVENRDAFYDFLDQPEINEAAPEEWKVAARKFRKMINQNVLKAGEDLTDQYIEEAQQFIIELRRQETVELLKEGKLPDLPSLDAEIGTLRGNPQVYFENLERISLLNTQLISDTLAEGAPLLDPGQINQKCHKARRHLNVPGYRHSVNVSHSPIQKALHFRNYIPRMVNKMDRSEWKKTPIKLIHTLGIALEDRVCETIIEIEFGILNDNRELVVDILNNAFEKGSIEDVMHLIPFEVGSEKFNALVHLVEDYIYTSTLRIERMNQMLYDLNLEFEGIERIDMSEEAKKFDFTPLKCFEEKFEIQGNVMTLGQFLLEESEDVLTRQLVKEICTPGLLTYKDKAWFIVSSNPRLSQAQKDRIIELVQNELQGVDLSAKTPDRVVSKDSSKGWFAWWWKEDSSS